MTYLIIALTAIVSYLIGSVNFSILLSKMLSGKDIRESGSGNAGATNMLRTYGKKMGVITLLLDVLKGIVVILLSRLVKNIAGIQGTQNIDIKKRCVLVMCADNGVVCEGVTQTGQELSLIHI